jgi:hypothetical protein|nr:MAG TPA: hypothetical protein [Caudoviricetes sp.]
MTYIIPPINTKGVFIFHPPYADDTNINKKEYEVIEIRKIKALHDDGLDPLNSIYIKAGLTKEDFIEDLNNDVPIVTLSADGDQYLYIPADRIKEMPAIIGHTATERLVTLSLGLMPDDINLEMLYENIAIMVNDTISVKPDLTEHPGGPTVLMSDEDYNKYIKMMSAQARSNNKSWRVRYEEMEQLYKLQKVKVAEIEKILQRFMSTNQKPKP